MTLTEQWKKGELPDGFYYFKTPDGAIEIASEYRLIRYNLTKDADKIEVLAPVPSYEEWQQLHKFLEEFNALEVAKENQQLKELLKECYKMLAQYHVENSEPSLGENIELLTKIDNAIGEKK